MKRIINISLGTTLCLILLIGLNLACAKRQYAKPAGNNVGSCKGIMKLTSGKKIRFVFDVYKEPNGDFKAFMSIPGRRIKYMPVENISFEDDKLRVEIEYPERVYEGKITGESLTITGKWNQYEGTLHLDLKKRD